MKSKKLREHIADYLKKQIENGKHVEYDYVPGASEEVQGRISYESWLMISDGLIPLIKTHLKATPTERKE